VPSGVSVKLPEARLAIILTTLFIDMVGIGIVLPILPGLVRELIGGSVSQASYVLGLPFALYALCQFFFAPLIGALSDRFGRRPIIVVALIGLGLDYLILAFAPNIGWLVFGRVMAGILGATYSAATAYIADISPPEKRAENFGLIGMAFGFGFIAGPFIGGALGEYGLRLPFLAAAGLALLNGIIAVFVLPESLAPEKRRPFRWREGNPIGALVAVWRYRGVPAMLVAFIFILLAQHGLENIWVLYTQYRYGWSTGDVGTSLAVVGVLFALTQGVLVRLVLPRVGEYRTVWIGTAASALSFLLFGLATSGAGLYAVLVLYALGFGLSNPAMMGLVSRAVPDDKQGLLQGALGSLQTATGALSAPLMTGAFGYFVGPAAPLILPGAPFFLGAVLLVGGLAVIILAGARRYQPRTGQLAPERGH